MAEKPKDLEERTAVFAADVRRLPRTMRLLGTGEAGSLQSQRQALWQEAHEFETHPDHDHQEARMRRGFQLSDFLWPLAVWPLEFCP